MSDTPPNDHVIKDLQRLELGGTARPSGASWHQVTCSCGWTRKYVSRYRAEIMHGQHTSKELDRDRETEGP
jgi:hypothetical protein